MSAWAAVLVFDGLLMRVRVKRCMARQVLRTKTTSDPPCSQSDIEMDKAGQYYSASKDRV